MREMLERGKMERGVFEIVDTESLVPPEHLLRKIDAAVDFTRIYDMVEPLYCLDNGRPSIDPVVLFKMVLIQHLYGLPSLRRTAEEVSANMVREVLSSAPNIVLLDDPSKNQYPMPMIATDTNHTYVGRIREDNFDETVIHLWCVADQVRVGAATNAVRIAQKWIQLKDN